MRNLLEKIIQNSESVKFFSNTNLLLILVFLYKSQKEMEAKEISKFFKVDTDEISKNLLILEKNELIIKTTILDKSKKPAFLKSFYKINEKNYKKVLENIKNTVEVCLQKTN